MLPSHQRLYLERNECLWAEQDLLKADESQQSASETKVDIGAEMSENDFGNESKNNEIADASQQSLNISDRNLSDFILQDLDDLVEIIKSEDKIESSNERKISESKSGCEFSDSDDKLTDQLTEDVDLEAPNAIERKLSEDE